MSTLDAERLANEAADLRDSQAQARDARAESRDDDGAARERGQEAMDRSGGRASTRTAYREGAQGDRAASGHDRRAAAEDRRASAVDRRRSAALITSLQHDELTGFYQRGTGMTELEREVVMAHRTGEVFTVAFVDIDGLKVVNDASGHEAGDRLIRLVADAIRPALREYDVAVRYGGDEFVCGMQGLEESKAHERFTRMQEQLTQGGAGTAAVGIAQLQPHETLQDVVTRADQAMYEAKARRSGG